jgi:hypothetical protein
MKYKIGDKVKIIIIRTPSIPTEAVGEIEIVDEGDLISYRVAVSTSLPNFIWVAETEKDYERYGNFGYVLGLAEEVKPTNKNSCAFFQILKRESDEKTKKEDAARPKNSPFEWL